MARLDRDGRGPIALRRPPHRATARRRAGARRDRGGAAAAGAGHGPARDRDLARWAGLPLRDARAGLGAIAGELVEANDGLLDLARRPAGPAARLPPPRLLGAFDPLLLGWTSREDILGEHADSGIVTSNGIFRPFALVRGRAAGLWRLAAGGVALEPFGRLASSDAAALRRDAADVERFLGQA